MYEKLLRRNKIYNIVQPKFLYTIKCAAMKLKGGSFVLCFVSSDLLLFPLYSQRSFYYFFWIVRLFPYSFFEVRAG